MADRVIPRHSVAIEDELWLALLDLAAENRTNASEEIRKAIASHLEEHGHYNGRADTHWRMTRQEWRAEEPA
jgi:hypothetical protein